MSRRRSTYSLVATAALALACLARPVGAATSSKAHRAGAHPSASAFGPIANFDRDGYGDLAIGAPGENIGSESNAGGINVVYGSASELSSARNQFWSQDSSGIIGTSEPGDGFGSTVAVGDFNNDGYTDLAAGVPHEGNGGVADSGGVNVIYGSASGLASSRNEYLDLATADGTEQAGAELGLSLTARDLNGDGYTDLAVGVPHERTLRGANTGEVIVFWGYINGLQHFWQVVRGTIAGGEFGSALASGNFNGDHYMDLAIGAPGDAFGGFAGAGLLWTERGSREGLHDLKASDGRDPVAGGHCGAALAAANFDGDPFLLADVAVGCPNGAYGRGHDQGGVELHFGSPLGIQEGSDLDTYPWAGCIGGEFGSAMAVGRFGQADGEIDQLDIADPLCSVADEPNAGLVEADDIERYPIWEGHQGPPGTPNAGDLFGASMTSGNFNGDAWSDLVVGVPGKTGGGAARAGAVDVLYGSRWGFMGSDSQFWSQNSPGIIGLAESEDFFGSALTGRSG